MHALFAQFLKNSILHVLYPRKFMFVQRIQTLFRSCFSLCTSTCISTKYTQDITTLCNQTTITLSDGQVTMVSNYFTLMHLGGSKETCVWSQFNLKHNQMYFVIIMKLNVRKANAAMCKIPSILQNQVKFYFHASQIYD